MLWGIVANAAYTSGENKDAIFSRLHGAGVVIGDAWPMIGADVALPIPKSLHRSKDGGAWEDWSTGARNPGYRQAKEGQVGPSKAREELTEVMVGRVSTQRTAINPETLTAADGQFYSLQALAAGQKFLALLEGQDVETAINVLTGEHFVGRSRNAEFGRVTIRPVPMPNLPNWGQGQAHYLWCLSDIAAHDDQYLPSERPSYLFDQEIDWSKSFVRHRRYSPFNFKWGRRQSERLVIARGSVLVLKSGVEPGLRRAGFWQEQGLGLVLASCAPLLELLRDWRASHFSEGKLRTPLETNLSRWLSHRSNASKLRSADRDRASAAWPQWRHEYEQAIRLQGETCGPSPSQWAGLVDLDEAGVRTFLAKAQNTSTEQERLSWQARFAPGPEGTFADKALALLDNEGVEALVRTAKVLRDALKRERWFDDR
jgi:hypothetical protein